MGVKLTQVRRLSGVNFHLDCTGAVAEATLPDEGKTAALANWQADARRVLDAVGWGEERIVVRDYPGGASTAISAPMDALFAATEVIEFAWALADDTAPSFGKRIDELKDVIGQEQSADFIALADAAAAHDVTFLAHDGGISVGLGTGCLKWPEGEMPDAAAIDWTQVHDVPVAMVTGTNGKSTTVRLAAAIGAAAGRIVGQSSTDWVRVGDKVVAKGDYSGPAGARLAVRNKRVELAIVETARGGLMRRGLPIPRADACLITNIAADHLGDYGITDVPALGDAKFVVSKAVRPGGWLILNADDPELVDRGSGFDGQIFWYGLTLDATDGDAPRAWLADGTMMLSFGGQTTPILAVNDFAPAMKGAAKYNISNALGAIALAAAIDLPTDAMTRALADFESSAASNPGRGNFMDVGGATVLIDFAHNPHGVAALAEAVAEVPAKRRLILIGQAGDRSDEDTRELTRAAWLARPDMVVVKELTTKLRGRIAGELPAVIVDELKKLGAADTGYAVAQDEFGSVMIALEWARTDDLLILLLHENRDKPLALLDRLQKSGWQAGDPLPAPYGVLFSICAS